MTEPDGRSNPDQPEPGSVRYDEQGRVEFYDGTEWKPYGAVTDADEPPVFRDEITAAFEAEVPGPAEPR
ncbi:hypothetical protein H0H10_20340 [Streptomyces sp. TRM S81-3]|uniref:Uncharacterized protein n=1 Tax=Streptomyces griseicoloratus TaxID=2752516 RepID=A0A926L6W5_9ACTN|nr:hypothetical protein [Streptomyces griseicoloratus]MBD0421476.1 hypothetical protein [Streptomyces griseicoloratus]